MTILRCTLEIGAITNIMVKEFSFYLMVDILGDNLINLISKEKVGLLLKKKFLLLSLLILN